MSHTHGGTDAPECITCYPRPMGCHDGCIAYSPDVRLVCQTSGTLVIECDLHGSVVASYSPEKRRTAEAAASDHAASHRVTPCYDEPKETNMQQPETVEVADLYPRVDDDIDPFIKRLVTTARDLCGNSSDGENNEYERGICELLANATYRSEHYAADPLGYTNTIFGRVDWEPLHSDVNVDVMAGGYYRGVWCEYRRTHRGVEWSVRSDRNSLITEQNGVEEIIGEARRVMVWTVDQEHSTPPPF